MSRSDVLVTADWARENLSASIRAFRDDVLGAIGTANLVDVRSPDEFSGRLLGHTDVRNYDGSWTEYGSLIGVPIERDA
jgi:3-mercaptopyruvate sulfurtransferase SseA